MLKYKILIKLCVFCMLICCVYGDTNQAEVVALCLLVVLYSMRCFRFKKYKLS